MSDARPQGKFTADIVMRLLSAAVMIPFALFVVWAGGWWMTASGALMAGLMGFEWARLTGERATYIMIPFAVGACLALIPTTPVISMLILLSGAILCILVMTGNLRGRIAAGFGCIYAGGIPLAIIMMREGPWDGRSATLILMAIVWASDSAAYFAGKGFGGPLLAPKDSPNKTWSGAIGGVICSAMAGLIAAQLMGASAVLWLVSGGMISVIAQYGDMFESQIKRRYDVKDVSGFLPGHGGVMDRVDGLGAVFALALVVFLLLPVLVAGLGFAQ